MADLRQSLNALVIDPPVAPASLDAVAARSAIFVRRRRVRRGMGALAFALVAIVPGLGIGFDLASRGSDDGVEIASDGRASAGYIAEKPGGYVASGEWRITITRGAQVIEISSTTSDYCGPVGVILPGDEVRGSISGAHSKLRVGEKVSCPT